MSPSSHYAGSEGDGDGFEVNPANAFSDDGLFAVDYKSGTTIINLCSDPGKDNHVFADFNINIPTGSTIDGVEVRFDAMADSTSSSPGMCVDLSWDGGNTWTSDTSIISLGASEATYYKGGSQDLWGHSWAVADLSNTNFRVRIINVAGSKGRDFYLDWVAVDVYYTESTAAVDSTGKKGLAIPNSITERDDIKSLVKSPVFKKILPAFLMSEVSTTTIAYTYDDLGRLTHASYDDGTYFDYTYDSVGNRLSKEISGGGVITSTYDIANRLTNAGGTAYTWDDNGNLLNDGVITYTYNHANRLMSVSGASSASYTYNGLGNRLQQTVDSVTTTYSLDLAAGLTQVLADGDNTYLYGIGRIGEEQLDGWVYHHSDALGSVRQLTDESGAVTLVKGYKPYGEVLSSAGDGVTSYAFTGEWADTSGLIFLRARYYAPDFGRFISRDTWQGDYARPLSLNAWNYVEANPINLTDPSGHICLDPWAPSGVHFDPNRGCDYPEGSTGTFWWRRDPLGPDTAIIDMPWVDELSPQHWNQYPNSCGAAALYMFLRGENIPVDFHTLSVQLQQEREGGYDPYCCRYRDDGSWGIGGTPIPSPTPDPLGWCNSACVSAETLAVVARNYYGLNIESGDNWTHQKMYNKLVAGHPVVALIRVNLSTNQFGHFVTIRGFVDGGWTVIFNDSYPAVHYVNRSVEERQLAGEGRREEWNRFDVSWASAVDRGDDPLSPQGHVRWAMAVK